MSLAEFFVDSFFTMILFDVYMDLHTYRKYICVCIIKLVFWYFGIHWVKLLPTPWTFDRM